MAAAVSEDEIQNILAAIQLEQSVKMYNMVTETAFRQCVHGFRTNTLTPDERTCIGSSTTKLLRHAARIKQRVSDIQDQQQERLKQSVKDATATKATGLPSV